MIEGSGGSGPLFEHVYNDHPPFQNHSQTSFEAAQAARKASGGHRRAILDFLTRGSGATDEALQDALGLDGSTERPRRRELQLAGLIKDSGRTALTKSGRKAVVWVVVS